MTLSASLWNGLSTVVDLIRYATQPDFNYSTAVTTPEPSVTTDPTPFLPVIYGIFHDGSQDVLLSMYGRIEEARKRGAASIGLELTPSILSDPKLTNAFKPFAERALQLGMTVVPLEGEEEFADKVHIQMALSAIGIDGGFDINRLDHQVGRIEERIRWTQENCLQASPEEIRLMLRNQHKVEKLKRARALIEALEGDFDRYAELWEREILLNRTSSMESHLREKRPDMGIVGLGHSARFSKDLGYRLMDASMAFRPRPDMSMYPNLQYIMNRSGSAKTGRFVYENLRTRVLSLESSSADPDAAVDRACFLEPELFELVIRTGYGTHPVCTHSLAPDQHARYFKMSVADAEARIDDGIKKALSQGHHF